MSGGNQTIHYTTSGTKTVTLTVSNLLGNDVSTFEVEVNPSPELSVPEDFAACDNDFPMTLVASGNGNFVWGNGLGTDPVIEILPESSTTYDVVLTNEFNCSTSAAIDVTVLPSPIIDAGEDLVICEGESQLISGQGEGDIAWEHNPEGGLELTESPAESQYLFLTSSFENGCSSRDSLWITVNPLPMADAGFDQEICLGEIVQIAASGGDSYDWDNNLGSGSSHNISPSETTLYTVTVGTAAFCYESASVLITVNPIPTAGISEGTSICFGESVIISATGGESYFWNEGLGAGAEHEVSPETTTNYTVEVFNEFDCSASASVEIVVYPEIILSIVGINSETYCHNDPNAYNLLGIPSGGTFTGFGVNNNQFLPSTAGVGPVEITYSYQDEFECEFTLSQLVTVDICEGISEMETVLEIYPNPAKEELWIKLSDNSIALNQYRILDSTGKLVQQGSLNFTDKILNVNIYNLSSGNYHLQLIGDSQLENLRFIKN